MNSKVSLVKSSDHKTGVTNCLNNLKSDLKTKLSEVKQVVIKINFVNTEPEIATTPFEAVKNFVEFVQPFYNGEIVITEEATSGDTMAAFKKYGYADLANKYEKVRLLNIKDDPAVNVTLQYGNNKELKLPLSKTIVETPFLVSITRPKTHNAVVITLGIKNILVGVIKGSFGIRSKVHKGMHIHEIMVEVAKHSYPDFVLLDGTVGMEGNGPTSGTEIDAGWSLASFDALAADSVATKLMGFDIDDVGYLNMLKDENFGLLYPKNDIEIIGEEVKGLVKKFKPHETFEDQRVWRV